MILSIIIPVYNVERYIEDCVMSVVNQNLPFDMYELIIVDDCGNDSSMEIVQRLLKENPSINYLIVKHASNKGLSEARNSGISVAKGKYVMFLDSDDYYRNNSLLECITYAINHDLDILEFDFDEIFETKLNIDVDSNIMAFNDDIVTGDEYLKKMIDSNNYVPMVWLRMYSLKLIKDNRLHFTKGLISEDEDFTPKILLQANRVGRIPNKIYVYRRRDESITTRFRKNIDWVDSYLYIIKNLYKLSNEHHISSRCLRKRAAQLNSSIIKNAIKYGSSKEDLTSIIHIIKKEKCYKYSLYSHSLINIIEGIIMIYPSFFIKVYLMFKGV